MTKDLTKKEAMQRAVNFSEKYVQKGEYEFFPDAEVVSLVQEGFRAVCFISQYIG